LRTVGNAAQWIRGSIDSVRAREATASPAERVVLLSRELENVRAEHERAHEEGRTSYLMCEGLSEQIKTATAAIERHEKLVESSSEGMDGVKRESAAALPSLRDDLAAQEREYQVQLAIMNGFLVKIKELEARERAIEDELLQAETARGGK